MEGREKKHLGWRLIEKMGWLLPREATLLTSLARTFFLSVQDMNREVVKTDSATTRIPELDFEIPAFSQKGGES